MKPTIYIPSALAQLLIPRLPGSSCVGADEPALEWRARFTLSSAAWRPLRQRPDIERIAALPCCA